MQRTDNEIFIPEAVFHPLRRAMLASRTDHEEVIGFLSCRRCRLSQRRERWVPRAWIVPDRDCYEQQSAGGIVLRQEFHRYLLKEYVGPRDGVVHIHTHPTHGTPRFSAVDDSHEATYARFLQETVGASRFLSGVYDVEMHDGRFRSWSVTQGSSQAASATLLRHWYDGSDAETRPPATPGMAATFDRQQVFGPGFQDTLGQLNVALIGCGGIGAPLAEQLCRLGVRRWILIDHDQIEVPNLNRMPFATRLGAERRVQKVRHVKTLIKRMWPRGSHVCCVASPVETKAIRRQIGTAHVIIVATDNHHSRLVAHEIAREYMRPLISLGSHIDMRGNVGQPRLYSRITVPPLGGGWCLVCGEVIDPKQAALEQTEGQVRDLANAAGYIAGVSAPAVYWLNSVTASMGISVIHQGLVGMLDVEKGLDWVVGHHDKTWRTLEHEQCPNCFYCAGESSGA